MQYNAVLRGTTGVPFLISQCEKLCNGNGYVTTLHVINSAIVKMGKLTAANK